MNPKEIYTLHKTSKSDVEDAINEWEDRGWTWKHTYPVVGPTGEAEYIAVMEREEPNGTV